MKLDLKLIPRILLTSAILTTITLTALSQTPVPPSSRQNAQLQIGQIKPQPIPDRSVGLDPGKIVRWSLRDAIMMALENNVEIQIEKENVRLAEYDLFAARGFYDPTFTSRISWAPQRSPNVFAFSGTNAAATVQNATIVNFGFIRPYEKTGGQLQVDFNNSRLGSNINLLSPQYSPNMQVSFTQPLKRNYKIDAPRRQIKILNKRLGLSDAQFRSRAIEIISRVQQAYWDLAFAIKDEEIQREAVKLAETQLRNNQRQVEIGSLAPIDVVTAATSVESRRISVFSAMSVVAQAENTLKQLLVSSPETDLWNSRIEPTESFELQSNNISVDEALRVARENRPELKFLNFQKDINDADLEFFRDQTKPQIDAFASYGISGVAGDPVLAPDGTTRVSQDFQGNYFTAIRNLSTNKYPTLRVGVTINIPWKNKIAEANLGRSMATGRQLELQVRQTVQSIETQIRNDLQSIELVKMRLEAARLARDYAQKQLDGEDKRFQAGLGTTFLILQRQTELAQAKGAELRALTDYNKLVAQLQRDIATTLTNYNIEVKSDANPEGDKK